MDRDMVFRPKTRTEYASGIGRLSHEVSELMEETPIRTLLVLVGQQLVGWPMYLVSNITGHNCHERQIEGKGQGKKNGLFGGVNHFNPTSPLFERKDEHLIILSDIGLALVFSVLYYIGKNFGWSNLFVWYFLPYIWVNHWLGKFLVPLFSLAKSNLTHWEVAITYLQHTDPTLPHYDTQAWNFVRGAAATIDREFGFIGRQLLHGIIETHVLHHYVSTIPFYNADEATEAIKPIMGQHYRSDTKDGPIGFIRAMWNSSRLCNWVEPCVNVNGENKGVLFFRNRNHVGVPPLKVEKKEIKVGKGEKAAKMTVLVGTDSDGEQAWIAFPKRRKLWQWSLSIDSIWIFCHLKILSRWVRTWVRYEYDCRLAAVH